MSLLRKRRRSQPSLLGPFDTSSAERNQTQLTVTCLVHAGLFLNFVSGRQELTYLENTLEMISLIRDPESWGRSTGGTIQSVTDTQKHTNTLVTYVQTVCVWSRNSPTVVGVNGTSRFIYLLTGYMCIDRSTGCMEATLFSLCLCIVYYVPVVPGLSPVWVYQCYQWTSSVIIVEVVCYSNPIQIWRFIHFWSNVSSTNDTELVNCQSGHDLFR